MDFKNFNMATIQKYTSPQAMKDFDRFLDALPLNVGYNALIAAGIVCLMAAASVWFSAVQLQNVGKLHTELTNVQALQPPVPVLKYMPVGQAVLKPLTEKNAANFKGLKIEPSEGTVKISVSDTDYFPQFLAAISYLQQGGKNWKVKMERFCVGRDCKPTQLSAELKVETVTFSTPEAKSPETEKGKK